MAEGEAAILAAMNEQIKGLVASHARVEKGLVDLGAKVERWQERHEKRHQDELAETHDGDVELARGLTELKGAVSLRTWLGALVSFATAAIGALGLFRGGGPTASGAGP
jgi:hypothetical protein